MAATASSQDPPRDPTFRNYSAEAAKKYLEHRRGYADRLIQRVIDLHSSSQGGFDVLLDVGCGPGTATRDLAPYFQHAVGTDPGESMIATARSVPSTTKSGETVSYELGPAEALSSLPGLKKFSSDGSGCVDLITAATAAHWFDMPRFWAEAAKVLKPGGSVIIWGSGGYYPNPNTTPNYKKMWEFMKAFEEEHLAPFEQPGNKLSRELYVNLGMPWECLERLADDDEGKRLKQGLQEFDEKAFVRLEFNKDGYVEPGETFFSQNPRLNFQQAKLVMGTASPVTRWREAHKAQLEKGEVEDIVDFLVRRSTEILEEVEEGKGRDWIDGGSAIVILLVKKKSR
jgi:trans-aconitate 3-methyltransferase